MADIQKNNAMAKTYEHGEEAIPPEMQPAPDTETRMASIAEVFTASSKANRPSEEEPAGKRLELVQGQKTTVHVDHSIPMLAGKKSRADIAIELMAKSAALFHTAENDTYAQVLHDDHYEVWSTRSKGFELWLRHLYYLQTETALKKPDLNTAILEAEAKAMFDGPEIEVGLRVASYDGTIYVDLCNRRWEQIQINSDGWHIIPLEESPVKFRRAKGMLPLPYPEMGGDLNWFKALLNLEKESDWCLIASWLVGAMNPSGPYPILILQGEQGTAKSTLSRFLRGLLDPSTVPTRTLPRTERDLAISAEAARVLCYDNVSDIKDALSDAFCRVATGGGFGTRTLYTDKSEELFNSMRPMIFNGISDLTVKHDFADRTLIVTLPPIKAEDRLPESVIKEQWAGLRPSVLGALCDAVVIAMRNAGSVKLERSPRMADFAKWVVSAEPALPWEPGSFMKAYDQNRFELIDVAIESDPISLSVLEMMTRPEAPEEWSGTPTALLKRLANYVPNNAANKKGWPQAPNIFSGRLRRVQTFLRAKGIDIERSKSGNREITLRMNGNVV